MLCLRHMTPGSLYVIQSQLSCSEQWRWKFILFLKIYGIEKRLWIQWPKSVWVSISQDYVKLSGQESYEISMMWIRHTIPRIVWLRRDRLDISKKYYLSASWTILLFGKYCMVPIYIEKIMWLSLDMTLSCSSWRIFAKWVWHSFWYTSWVEWSYFISWDMVHSCRGEDDAEVRVQSIEVIVILNLRTPGLHGDREDLCGVWYVCNYRLRVVECHCSDQHIDLLFDPSRKLNIMR